MMKPGRAPKTNVLPFVGDGKDNTKPKFEVPDCPSHIQGSAREEWDRISILLGGYKLITDLDTAALALYCASYGRWQQAESCMQKMKEGGDEFGLIIRSPSGYPIQNPYLAIANRAMEDCHRYLQQFGLSPAARTRVNSGMQGDLFNNPNDEKGKKYF